jgi:glucokinase
MYLVGDIGGTKTILAVFPEDQNPRQAQVELTYPSSKYNSLEDIIAEFLSDVHLPISGACFGVAGPVLNGRATITNLPWIIDAEHIKAAFNLKQVHLLNDLESIAYAIPILTADDLHTLNPGKPIAGGNIAVVAPGTGLGEAFLTSLNGKYYAHASEGGHVSFSPVGELQIGLLQYMNQQGHAHVSCERVCSGGLGIPYLYAYLKSIGYAEEPAWLTEQLAATDDPTPVIFNTATSKGNCCDLAKATLNLFVEILGVECGNLAIKILATGGIYLGGGIPPRILQPLQESAFLNLIQSKGRFRGILEEMPVHVIINTKAGLMGAAAYGQRQLAE